MFTIEQRGDVWVVLDGDGEVESEHETEDEARARADELNAADDADNDEDEIPGPPAAGVGGGRRVAFDPLMIEGEATSDGRRFANVTVRETPLSLMFLDRNPEGDNPHGGARLAGRIDEISRLDDGRLVGLGTLDDGPIGTEAERQIEAGNLRGVSVDGAGGTVDVEVVEVNDDGEPVRVEATFDGVEIGGATLVPFPAFRDAQVRLLADGEVPEWSSARPADTPENSPQTPSDDSDDESDSAVEGVAAAGGPLAPPVEWFSDPEFDRLTPLTVTDDGRIYGHVAPWDACHLSYGDRCVPAPRSESGYSYFRTGYVVAAGADDRAPVEIPTGTITLGTGHAGRTLRAQRAAEHYDHTGTAVADVAAGEDDFGPWVAGAVRPGLTDEQIRALRGASLSGDWRRVGTSMELVAVLAVNVPGYAIPRAAASFTDDRPLALVAAGVLTPESACGCGSSDLAARIRRLEAVVAPLEALAADRLSARLHDE